MRNTSRALAPVADAHRHPHKSVLSSLNYSILDYLITLQPHASVLLTRMQEVTKTREKTSLGGRNQHLQHVWKGMLLLHESENMAITVHFHPGKNVNHHEHNKKMNKTPTFSRPVMQYCIFLCHLVPLWWDSTEHCVTLDAAVVVRTNFLLN